MPRLMGAFAQCPFDIIATYYRGWQNAIMDVYSRTGEDEGAHGASASLAAEVRH